MRQRKLMLPPLHGERMARYGQLIEEITASEVVRWPVGRTMPLQGASGDSPTGDFRAVFGLDEARTTEQLRQSIKALLGIVATPMSELLMGLPGAHRADQHPGRCFERAVASTDEPSHRRDPASPRGPRPRAARGHPLAPAPGADEDGEAMTDREIRDELITRWLPATKHGARPWPGRSTTCSTRRTRLERLT